MVYQELEFPTYDNRPFFYTNFVTTLDGKVQVIPPDGYWPLGSNEDYQTLIGLRTYADLLIHGKNTALNSPTLQNLAKPEFKEARRERNKPENLPYLIMSRDRKEVGDKLGTSGYELSSEEDLARLAADLFTRGFRHVLMEGGPTLMGEFLRANLIDQIFLTISPKIVGNKPSSTLTMVEGVLFPPEQVKRFKILSVKQEGDELFLRYESLSH